jgi:hypothetical protein
MVGIKARQKEEGALPALLMLIPTAKDCVRVAGILTGGRTTITQLFTVVAVQFSSAALLYSCLALLFSCVKLAVNFVSV